MKERTKKLFLVLCSRVDLILGLWSAAAAIKTPTLVRTVAWLLILGMLPLLSACRDGGKTIWSQEVTSPDGLWVAVAATKQWSGPGTAYVATTVHLRGKSGVAEPVEVLGFSNPTAYPLGITGVKMTWTSPRQLSVTYGQAATLDFQVTTCVGIKISAQAAVPPA